MIRPALGYRVRRIGVEGVEFLLRDDFITDEAAPITSPRTCEPGPGTLTVVDTGNDFSISGGVLNYAAGNEGDPGFWDNTARTRVAGLMTVGKSNRTASLAMQIGFDSNSADGVTAQSYNTTSTQLRAMDGGVITVLPALSVSTDYELCIILRTAGAFYLAKGGAYADWTLLMVKDGSTVATLYPGFTNWNSIGTLDSFRVAQLATPWDTDNGIATDEEAGVVAEGTTFVHEADCLIEFTLDTVPSAGDALFNFKIQDSSNYWQLRLLFNGFITLREVVAGAATARGDGNFLSNGVRIVIICDDETITVYVDNIQAYSYSSAANFKTETDGELDSLGIGGVVSDIVTWPRTLSGDALTELEKYTQP